LGRESVVYVVYELSGGGKALSEGKRLKALRTKLQLSQKELASLLGMESWIPAWESGRSTPPPFLWVALAKLEAQQRYQKSSQSVR
jgi:DNA-binding XRE family transcriptional regulator